MEDGEYGGQVLGQIVWESFEASLKEREKRVADVKAQIQPPDKKES